MKKILKGDLHVVVDCDGILLDYQKSYFDFVASNYPELVKQLDDTKWDFGLGDELAWKIVKEHWASPGILQTLEEYPRAKEGFNQIAEVFDVEIVTALNPKFYEDRKINLHGFNYRDLTLFESKVPHIINTIKPDVCIEDSPKNIRLMSEGGITEIYCPILPYTENAGLEEYVIFYESWDQLVRLLMEKYG